MFCENISLQYGGGIQPDTNWFERNKNPSLIIGLGGMGIEVLTQLKRELCYNIGRNQNGGIERLSFLAIDSDKKTLFAVHEKNSFSEKEIIYIGGGIHPALPKTYIPSWFDHNIQLVRDLNNGAGMIRQVGRLLFLSHMQEIYNRLFDSIRNLATSNCSDCMKIYIISGIAGGTGSGVILDICYSIRDILAKLGLSNRSYISGFFLLPDLLTQRWLGSIDPSYRDVIYSNSYAALKELNYFMNPTNDGGRFSESYSWVNWDMRIESQNKPADSIYLISEIEPADGNIMRYEYTIKETIDWIVGQLTNSRDIPIVIMGNGFYRFHTQSKVLPLREMNTYFISYALLKYLEFAREVPSPDDEYVKTILERCNVTPERLIHEFSRVGHNTEYFSNPLSEDQLSDMIHQYYNKVKIIVRELNGTTHGLLSRVLTILFDLLREKGFLVVANLLDKKNDYSIYNTLYAAMHELQERIKANKMEKESVLEEMKVAENAYISANMFARRAKSKEYAYIQSKYYRCCCEGISIAEAYNLEYDLLRKLNAENIACFEDLRRALTKAEEISRYNVLFVERDNTFNDDVRIRLSEACHVEVMNAIFENLIKELMLKKSDGFANMEVLFDTVIKSLSSMALPVLHDICREFLTISFQEAESLVINTTKSRFLHDSFCLKELRIPVTSPNIRSAASNIAVWKNFRITECDREDGIWYYEAVIDNMSSTDPRLSRLKAAYDARVLIGQHLYPHWRSALPDF